MGKYQDLDQFRSIDELNNHKTSLAADRKQLDDEYDVNPMPEDVLARFAALTETIDEIDRRVSQREMRLSVIAATAGSANHTEHEIPRAKPSHREQDIYDLSTVRAANLTDPGAAAPELRDRALRANDSARYWAAADRSKTQERVADLIDRDDEKSTVAKYVLLTGSPTYRTAFLKAMTQMPLNAVESQSLGNARALSLTGASGGFAVPFTLDPTILGTSNSNVNPFRQISRVVQITNDEWRGVSSGAITAAYAAEATETTDNAPTLVQPTISTEKAQAFIPFSIEVGMDWPSLEAEMGRLLAEAKDDLEAAKFTAGSGTNEPFGVLTGTTTTVNAAAGQTFTIANLYSLAAALPARYRPRASFVGSLAVINRIRQFDTAGGANLWETLANDAPSLLLGKPFYELSEMADVATSVKFLLYGDFSRFVIVDRIGLTIETVQHIVGTNHRPTGQRGLFAYWRNSSKVVDANAFRALIGVA